METSSCASVRQCAQVLAVFCMHMRDRAMQAREGQCAQTDAACVKEKGVVKPRTCQRKKSHPLLSRLH